MRRVLRSSRPLLSTAIPGLARKRRFAAPAGAVAVGILLLLLVVSGGRWRGAEAHVVNPGPDSPVVGIDMIVDDDGDTTPDNTGTSLGAIDPCIEVDNTAGTQFTIDAWLDAVPNDLDLDGYNYALVFPDTATKMVGQDNLLMLPAATDISASTPDSVSPHEVAAANLDFGNEAPGGTSGALGRYTMEVVTGGASGFYYFSFDPTPLFLSLVDSSANDWWTGPPPRGADVWDASHNPQYGILALSVLCSDAPPPPQPTPPPTPTPPPPGSPGGFNPTGTAWLGGGAPGANSDIVTTFNVFAPDYNAEALISFIPPGFGLAGDASVPDGAIAGTVESRPALGLLNGPCANVIDVHFDMLDATVDDSSTVIFEEQFLDLNSDGLDDGVTSYPDYLTRIFPGAQPIARLYGATVVAGTNVSLNIVAFAPGTNLNTLAGAIVPDPALGYPSVTILQFAGDTETPPMPGVITDICSTLLSSTTVRGVTQDNPSTLADEAGYIYRTNPSSDGTFIFNSWAVSERDADGDGIGNPLDTCPLDPDPSWNPRDNDFDDDPDSDGIPNSCDPTPNDNTGFQDHDLDGFVNRQDNCPLVQNGFVGTNQHDGDLDGIGDSCDPNPGTPDGDALFACLANPVVVGSGGPTFPADPQPPAPCAAPPPTPTPTPSATPTAGPSATASPVGIVSSLGIGSATVEPGGSVTVALTAFANAPGIGAFSVDVAYEATKLSFGSCTAHASGLCNKIADGWVRFVGASATGLTGSLQLGTVTFTGGGTEGTAFLDVSIDTLTTPEGVDITVAAGDGVITIQAATPTPTATPMPTPSPVPTPAGSPTPSGGAPSPTCDGKPATIVGTGDDDLIVGTNHADVILALDGDDIVLGMGGDDVACLGEGKDLAQGGRGNDRIFGEGGRDRLFGGKGSDHLDGGPDKDHCAGGSGVNTLVSCEMGHRGDDHYEGDGRRNYYTERP